MKTRTFILLAMLGLARLHCDGAAVDDQITVNYSGNVVDSSGIKLNGATVEIGYFAGSFDAANPLPALLDSANWKVFDLTSTSHISLLGGDGSFNQAGHNTLSPFGGHQIYLLAFESQGTSISEYGLYAVPLSSNPAWEFPSSNVSPGDTTSITAPDAGIVHYWGSISSNGQSLQLQAVPEPGTYSLAAAGLLAFLAAAGRFQTKVQRRENA
jgi:hypothetical protein